MTNSEIKNLALDLLKADSEDEVIAILKDKGYWENPTAWRFLGDRENNYSTIGNQQSRPEAALTEKIINAIDARLMNGCLCNGVDPCSDQAPKTIKEAVAQFFGGKIVKGEAGGTVLEWDNQKRRQISEGITVALAGSRRTPCVTICDLGEGQTPETMPRTFLSIDGSNKLRIPFVQGKFNMGGTGVLDFCGTHSIQLIVSRRNPNIEKTMHENDASSDYWSFTIVRRQDPPANVKNSIFTYLAPVDSDNHPNQGKLLRFKSDSLKLFPDKNEAYAREATWGSAIKLFDYDMKGFSSHACMKDGLLYRIGAMIPEPALPIRIHECRDFKGHSGSFATTLTGLTVRLEDNKAENLETGFPDSEQFHVHGEKMFARIYAFKKGKADTYRTNEGVILTVNGQTHGIIPKSIFSRNSVKCGRIADSLLLMIDCSDLSPRAREKLFMNSRDRLRNNEFRKALEEELEDIIHNHPGLRTLKEQRRNEEISERLDDSKPLEDILQNIFKSSPSLTALFLTGARLSNPFNTQKTGSGSGNGSGRNKGNEEYKGKPHPTFFKFKSKKYGEILDRRCEVGRRCRIEFETDVENEYFKRNSNPGQLNLELLEGSLDDSELDWSVSLHNGVANVSIKIPESAAPGDLATLQIAVSDDVISDPFVNVVKLNFTEKVERPGGSGKPRDNRGTGAGDGSSEPGIQLPKWVKVHEAEWPEHKFDKFSACKIIRDEDETDEHKDVFTFYINIDNIYLKTEMKNCNGDARLEEAKFIYANILFGLGLIKQFADAEAKPERTESEDEPLVEEYVMTVSRALSPFILPLIKNLGSLSENDLPATAKLGDDE